MKSVIVFAVAALLLASCVPQKDFDALQAEHEALKNAMAALTAEVEEYRNGPERTIALIRKAYEDANLADARAKIAVLTQFHPEELQKTEVKNLISRIDTKEKELAAKKAAEEKAAAQKREAAEKERVRTMEADAKAFAAKQAAAERERLAAVNKLRKNFDDVTGVTWYYNPYFQHYNNSNAVSVYMGQRNNSAPWLRLKISCFETDELFIFDTIYLSYDGNTKEITFSYDEKKSDLDLTKGFWEWIDVTVNADTLAYLRNFAASPNAKIRLTGKYSRTRNLSWNERQGILDVLKAYDALRAR